MPGVSGVGILEIAERAGLDSELVTRLVNEMHDTVAGGERLKLRGFGSFEARDPKVDSSRTPPVKFNPSESLKARIHEREERWHELRIDPDASEEE